MSAAPTVRVNHGQAFAPRQLTFGDHPSGTAG